VIPPKTDLPGGHSSDRFILLAAVGDTLAWRSTLPRLSRIALRWLLLVPFALFITCEPSMNDLYTLERGDAPLLISIPHLGQAIPDSMRHLYTDIALTVADTDWHLDTLYAWAREQGATLLSGRLSRYVIDLNRPPNDESLYPGQTTTGLCPTGTFRGEPVYREGAAPDAAQKSERVKAFWQPYYDALRLELARLRALHQNVLLWKAHSIASVLPRLFEGKLPDLNFGTQDGRTAAPAALDAVLAAAAQGDYTFVANGRFKGG
jgi:N-formylglutamate deformylase